MTKTVRLSHIFIFLVSVFALNSESFAARGDFGKPTIGAMMLMGTGQMGNDTDVLKRNMLSTPLAVFAGINYKKFRFGINYEYNVVGQTDDPASFGNQNIGGKGSAAGIRLEFYNGKHAFGMIYRASEKYTLDKATLAGTVSEYDGKGGFGIQYYRQIKNRIGIVVDYSMGTLNSAAGNSDDLTWNRTSLGLVFTNFAARGR